MGLSARERSLARLQCSSLPSYPRVWRFQFSLFNKGPNLDCRLLFREVESESWQRLKSLNSEGEDATYKEVVWVTGDS